MNIGACLVGDVVRFPDGAVARLAWPGRLPVKGSAKKGEIAGWFVEVREDDFGDVTWSEPRWFDASAQVEVIDSPNSRGKVTDGDDDSAGDVDPLRARMDKMPKRHNPNQGGIL